MLGLPSPGEEPHIWLSMVWMWELKSAPSLLESASRDAMKVKTSVGDA